MKLRIADFNIEVVGEYPPYFQNALSFYKSDFENADVTFEINEDDVQNEVKFSEDSHRKPYLQYIALLRKLGNWLPTRNGFVLHSACFDVEGEGIAFAAHSGTGKTTHMNRWQQYLGDKMKVVNGDKPIVRFFEGEEFPYAYGTPWNGKENLGNKMRTPLKHICFIERSETNYVEKMAKDDAVSRIFNQVYISRENPLTVMNALQLVNRLLTDCNLWVIHCNMDDNAGEIAYKTIFGK